MSLFPKKKKVFMKNYSKEDNVKLIKLVEQRECLWNCKHWEYFKKPSAQKAWEDIAKILNDTPRKSQQRWRTIRNMYGKNIHPTLRNKSTKYYLEPYLDFLRPFIRSCCRSKTCCQLAGKTKHKNVQDGKVTNKRVGAVEATSENVSKLYDNNWSNTIQKTPKTKSSEMMFLESLLPFVDEMTNCQTRRFRLKVLTLIDNILD
ncbi:uncharacterized protein LOC129941066 [Eupeodes corollae]|uniref:uncharacterized protein LOC129941066 n=1 Tax=Eupeodes corollae TaxID=290404 RepID=UPI0024923552|nr:uncharacterized protein LOC129941066 [Eupeodes corollae]